MSPSVAAALRQRWLCAGGNCRGGAEAERSVGAYRLCTTGDAADGSTGSYTSQVTLRMDVRVIYISLVTLQVTLWMDRQAMYHR